MFGLAKEAFAQQYVEEFVCEYGFVRQEQLNRLLANAGFAPKKSRSYLHTVRSYCNKIFFDKKTDGFYACNYVEPTQERFFAMDKCLWVLIDFLGKIEHHFPVASAFSPSQICMMPGERSYEIAYCPAGQEAYFARQLRAARVELLYRLESSYFLPMAEKEDSTVLEATRYIVVVESIAAAQAIQSGLIAYFVTLDEANICTFYPADTGQKEAQAHGTNSEIQP